MGPGKHLPSRVWGSGSVRGDLRQPAGQRAYLRGLAPHRVEHSPQVWTWKEAEPKELNHQRLSAFPHTGSGKTGL